MGNNGSKGGPKSKKAPASAKALNVNLGISSYPTSIEEFTKLRDEFSKTPQGAAAIFILAQAIYVQNQDLGLQCMTLAVDIENLVDVKSGPNVKGKCLNSTKIRDLETRLLPKDYIARASFEGAKVENNYKPNTPLKISMYQQSIDVETGNRLKIFVDSSGADAGRPITLAKNSAGIWKAFEWSSLQVGVLAPPKVVVDDL